MRNNLPQIGKKYLSIKDNKLWLCKNIIIEGATLNGKRVIILEQVNGNLSQEFDLSKKNFWSYFSYYIPENNINPEHYKIGHIETFDYLKAKLSPTQLAGFCKGNVIKYLSRADHKNKLEDLKKAKWYLDKLIDELDHE